MTAVPQSQVSISRRALDIEDYIDVARRHVSWIIGPLYAGIAISIIVAFFLPNVYVSRAMLRVTPSQIPENLVPATFNQQMSDRINQMWQDVVSRNSLGEMIARPSLNLYPSERNHKPLEDVIEDMKSKDIKLEILGVTQAGKPNSTFNVTYRYQDRFKAHDVVAALVTKLVDANQVAQRTIVNSTNDLMSDEAKAAKEELDRLDSELTAFKMANSGRLPEQLQLNVGAQSALQSRLAATNDALQRNSQQKLLGEQTLTSLKSNYIQLESALTSSPEEAVATKEATVKNDELIQLNHEIHQGEAQLAVARQNLTPEHPDYKEAVAKLGALKSRRDQMVKDDAAATAALNAANESNKSKAVAPRKAMSLQNQQALVQIRNSIDSTKAQLDALEMDRLAKQKELERLNTDLQNFQARIEASPINEQKYMSLMGSRRAAAERFEGLQKKQQLAAQGIEINNRRAGETLDILDQASLPETPTEPNRWQIVAIGAVLGLFAGVAMAGAKEMKDTSLKNLKDVRAYTNLPVLSSIPLLENALLVRRKRRLAYVGWAIAIIVGLFGTAVSLYYHYQISTK